MTSPPPPKKPVYQPPPVSQTQPPLRFPPKPSGLLGLTTKPNFIIFMPDQLRYDALGCTGNKHVQTPNIDAFAAQQGTLFTNCFVQASVCAQSRCSIFTGNYPHVSGHRSLESLIKPWEPNLFRSLREEGGYHVACLAPRGDTFAPEVTELSVDEYGFLETPEFVPKFGQGGGGGGGGGGPSEDEKEDIWRRLFYKGLRNAEQAMDYDDAVVRSALKWLERPPKDKPWVLFMPLIFPHCPFQVEEPYFSMYDRAEMPQPSSKDEKVSRLFFSYPQPPSPPQPLEPWQPARQRQKPKIPQRAFSRIYPVHQPHTHSPRPATNLVTWPPTAPATAPTAPPPKSGPKSPQPTTA